MRTHALKGKWLAPLVFFQLYLTLSVVFFFWGPWPWNVDNELQLAGYLVAAQIFIAVGYLLAWKRIHKIARHAVELPLLANEVDGLVFLKRGIWLTFILMIPTCLSRTGTWFPDVLNGLAAPGDVYSSNFERLEEGNAYVGVEYLRMLLSPLLIGIFPLTVVYWSRLSGPMRFFGVIGIIFNLSLYVATGTNKGIADFVLTLPWLMYLAISLGTLRLPVNKYFLLVFLMVLFFGFLQFFGAGQLQRGGGVGERGVFNTGFDIMQADPWDRVSVLLSSNMQVIYESITRYLGQGYYALSMTLGIDHESTLGFGNSMFLARNADALFGTTHFSEGSLPGLLEAQTGWGAFALWHSIYPWLASDFGFAGALVVLGGFAYLLGLSWGMSLMTLAPRWTVLCYLLLILFFYIPGNNQIFQTGETLFAFVILVVGVFLRSTPGHSTTAPDVAETGESEAAGRSQT